MTVYDDVNEAYDLVYTDVDTKIPFVLKVLEQYQKKDVLELGSGSGLFTIPLKKKGLNIEGVEISQEMLNLTLKKAPDLTLHLGDMRTYDLGKQFDAVLILSATLTLLQNQQEMVQCLQQTYKHLPAKGLLFLELPNHAVEIQQSEQTQEVYQNEDSSIVVVVQSFKVEQYWRENWHVFKSGRDGFQQNKVSCDEFLYDPEKLEHQIQATGFEIVERYGDLFGTPFDEASSWRRVLICRKL
ncbi:MAG: methyltransferase domain-containing protein [Cyanobacteria bacterium P01_B01_bin.77]